eukprot:m.233219 g.233219  ORF g.233219 m.233219 type:complete len:437 (-) comp17376_c0_seq1:2293-3603(-)
MLKRRRCSTYVILFCAIVFLLGVVGVEFTLSSRQSKTVTTVASAVMPARHDDTSGAVVNRSSFNTHADPIEYNVTHWKGVFEDLNKRADVERIDVEVWGKAAIGTYFIEAILGARLESKLNGVWFLARALCSNLHLTYRSGPGVLPHKVPKTAQHVVLVLNGHNDDKIKTATPWLDMLPTLPNLKHVGLIVLGYEDCSNTWLKPYLDAHEYKIRFVFLVYGGKTWLSHPKVQQWPLGVATYRDFPLELPYYQSLGPLASSHRQARRRWLCNLQATIYPNTSREVLLKVLQDNNYTTSCFIEARKDWHPTETGESKQRYQQALLSSDYTLAPVGFNSECYRWYEAAAAGSIPIVEDRIQPPSCGTDPLALIKESNAPFIYLHNWHELPAVLKRLQGRSGLELERHRQRLVRWYESFKLQSRIRFCSTASQAFNSAAG